MMRQNIVTLQRTAVQEITNESRSEHDRREGSSSGDGDLDLDARLERDGSLENSNFCE
jgi:hypothetical protein